MKTTARKQFIEWDITRKTRPADPLDNAWEIIDYLFAEWQKTINDLERATRPQTVATDGGLLAVGQVWRTRAGQTTRINAFSTEDDVTYPYKSDIGYSYTKEGRFLGPTMEHELDLVERLA